MSTKGARPYRPALHFTAPKMWLNDPNGLVFWNGQYHLFYQHNPHDNVWGPMYWGHAVSSDLVRWEHLPIALEPDELGYIFSGSSILDEANTSGFGQNGKVSLVVMYTSHHAETDLEQQSLAYSLDGAHFEKYAQNPVIPNPGIPNFRDPKLFWNTFQKQWGMVLAAGDETRFYTSPDFKQWTQTGSFGVKNLPPSEEMTGVWECPDLFPLTAPDGSQMWILLVSLGRGASEGGPRVRYFLGDFDGNTFHVSPLLPSGDWLDMGFDNYAGVTYANTPERIYLGWATSYLYAGDTPTGEYCGGMTFPRQLFLTSENSAVRLAQKPVSYSIKALKTASIISKVNQKHTAFLTLSLSKPQMSEENAPAGETFLLRFTVPGSCAIRLENDNGEYFLIGINRENEIFIDRSHSGEQAFSETYALPILQQRSAKRLKTGLCNLELLFDVSMVEWFADEGTRCGCAVVYPEKPYCRVVLNGEWQTAQLLHLSR